MEQLNDNWMIPIKVMLGSLYHGQVQACSISRVTDELRNPNEAAFKPKKVSIGLLHRGTTGREQLMEKTKWRYMREFLDRKGEPNQNRPSAQRLNKCSTDIKKLDKIIIASYGGNIESDPHELAKIMMVDGCFLLELLIRLEDIMKNENSSYLKEPLLESEEKIKSILNDIIMLENQIPFVVLKKLHRKVFPVADIPIENDHRVANIVQRAFGYPEVNNLGAVHILHLMHLSTVRQNQEVEEGRQVSTVEQNQEVDERRQVSTVEEGRQVSTVEENQQEGRQVSTVEQNQEVEECRLVKQELLHCATRLRAAGIIIEAAADAQTTTCHRLVDWFNFDINFSDNVLQIPPLKIKETTEVRWRNLIAWEQSNIWIKCKYTSYALFFQGLVCCKHDIELLEEKEVIVNEAKKSTEELLNLFRTISKGTEHMDSSYKEICEKLNKYQGRIVRMQGLPIVTWHKCRHVFEIIAYYWGNWFRILIRDHFPTVWKSIGVLAAAALLGLTIAQTIFSSRKDNR